MYETAMIKAITTVNMYKAPSILPWLFLDLLRDANRSKLLSLGDDLPSGDRLTVFRGVIDVDDPSRVRRTSWTLSSGIAAWFATVMGRNEESIKPGVFMLNVPKEKVFFYTNKRDEQEVVVDMYPQARPKLVEPMPEPLQPKD